MYKRRPKNNKDPTMEDPHSSAASTVMFKFSVTDHIRHKTTLFQFNVIKSFI
jgi:hypothetical protein